MKIDRRKIDTLCGMSDERLWGTLKFLAAANGMDISKKRVTPSDIAGVRRLLASLGDGDISRINELIGIYRYGR